ncbi:MAG: bifunctional DNA-formamidopyrimidine glycosylase/DNA-(apurinic or apyrimidinic site) lyase [Candidatus Paceibacterota bacterium]
MPELPEVESVVVGLRTRVIGRKFTSISVLHRRALRDGDGALPFRHILKREVKDVKRRGKFIWFDFGGRYCLSAHLGMSGQFLFAEKGGDLPRFARAVISLSGGERLIFNDMRTFGWISVEKVYSEGGRDYPESVRGIRPDVFDSSFNKLFVVERYCRSNAKIKALLLDQSIMSGVGNIYADEALFKAGINPERVGNSISVKEANLLISAVRSVMARATKRGGTSFDYQYVGVDGNPGRGSEIIKVYGRDGLPCKVCGEIIEKVPFGGRYSRYCPECQR